MTSYIQAVGIQKDPICQEGVEVAAEVPWIWNLSKVTLTGSPQQVT